MLKAKFNYRFITSTSYFSKSETIMDFSTSDQQNARNFDSLDIFMT